MLLGKEPAPFPSPRVPYDSTKALRAARGALRATCLQAPPGDANLPTSTFKRCRLVVPSSKFLHSGDPCSYKDRLSGATSSVDVQQRSDASGLERGNAQESIQEAAENCLPISPVFPAMPEAQVPDPVSWQRATAYRINTTSAVRSQGRKVIRNRKKSKASDSYGNDLTARSPPRRLANVTFGRHLIDESNPEDDERVLQDEESWVFTEGAHVHEAAFRADIYNLDPTEEDLARGPERTAEHIYTDACRRLGIIPIAGVVRRLASDVLSLKNMALGPKGARACAMALVNNIKVKKLDLEGNDIGWEGTLYISLMIKDNISITELNLSDNNIEAEGLKTLCQMLNDNSHIKVLDLSGNNLQDKDSKYVSAMLQQNRTLRELYLAHNAFSEGAGENLAIGIASNDALELLDVSWNHLRLQGAVALVLGLKENSCISTLNLAWNGLHVEGCRAFGEVLATTHTLTYLDLSCNRINFIALKFLLEGLYKNSSISVLKLGYNPITNEGAIQILRVIKDAGPRLPLRELDLSDICVGAAFIKLLATVSEERLISVKHGLLMKNDDLGIRPQVTDPFCLDDPMMVLMEFMRIRNLRLIDLFACLDKDGNKSLSREEFRDGLMSVNIPLSTHALNELIDKLDSNGDGEVDFSELLEGQKQHKKRLSRLLNKPETMGMSSLDNDISRVNTKIRTLMAMTTWAAQAKHRGKSTSEIEEGHSRTFDMAEAAARRLLARSSTSSEWSLPSTGSTYGDLPTAVVD